MMTTPTTPTPKKVGDLTLEELLALLRETATEALAGIVGYPDEKQEPREGAVVKLEPGAGASARMARKVGDLAVDELEWWIYYIVDEVGVDLIGDPDEGLELSAWVQEQLDQADADRAAGTLKTFPAEQVAKELGLE